jgi:hypothetical protein
LGAAFDEAAGGVPLAERDGVGQRGASPRKTDNAEGRQLSPEQAAAAAMVAEAKQRGLELAGPNGLLKLFTKNVLETALNEEMTQHLGHAKNQAETRRESTNVRNGSRSKTVLSDAAGEVRIVVELMFAFLSLKPVGSGTVGNETVPVAWVSNRIEGDLVAGLLQSEGIDARVTADDAGGQEPQLQLQSGAQVLVAPADEARAREILADVDRS